MDIKQLNIIPILENFKSDLQKIYGSQLESLILYGSYARGEENENSDIDVLVLLKKMDSPYSEIERMSDIKNEYLLDHEILISTIPTTTSRYQNTSTPLYRNIKKEGIAI